MWAKLILLFIASLLGSSKAPLQEPSEDAGEPDQQSRDREQVKVEEESASTHLPGSLLPPNTAYWWRCAPRLPVGKERL